VKGFPLLKRIASIPYFWGVHPMKKVFFGLLVGAIGLVLIAGTATTQEKKEGEQKVKGMLPPGWKKLNLSKEQVGQIYKVQMQFKEKIQKLEEQITELKTQERSEMVKFLTEDQKTLLRKLTIGEEGKKPKEGK
jgi:hypothetical protein